MSNIDKQGYFTKGRTGRLVSLQPPVLAEGEFAKYFRRLNDKGEVTTGWELTTQYQVGLAKSDPLPTHKTRVTPGQVMALLKDPNNPTKGSYAKIFRAAYPQGNKTEDDIALEFLEQAKMPYSADGMIDVADIEPALTYFMSTTPPYIDQSDFDRVMQGWPV